MMVHPGSPYRRRRRGYVPYEGNIFPLPKRVTVLSKYYIRHDIARSRGGSLGWLVVNIEVGAPTFTWYEFSTHHTCYHLQMMLHVDCSNILRYISVIDSGSSVFAAVFGIWRQHTIMKHHCLITSGGDVLSSQTYRFVVISSPGQWFWPYPLINRRFGWYSTRKCEWLDCRRVYHGYLSAMQYMCLYDMFFWYISYVWGGDGLRMIEET